MKLNKKTRTVLRNTFAVLATMAVALTAHDTATLVATAIGAVVFVNMDI